MNQFLTSVTAAPAVLILTALSACSDDKKSVPEAPLLGTLTVSESKNTSENAKFELRNGACTKNADTGKVTVNLSQQGDANKTAQIAVSIKDFQSTAKTYTCKQATDNSKTADSVGGKYDSCAIEFKVPANAAAASVNTYAMHRSEVAVKPFAYAGECTAQVTTATPNIVGKISCKAMVQTGLEGAARNPVDAGVTATVTADFNCTP